MHHAPQMCGELKHMCKDGTATQMCSQLHAQITLHPGTERMVTGWLYTRREEDKYFSSCLELKPDCLITQPEA